MELWEKIIKNLSKNSSIDQEIFNKYINSSSLVKNSKDDYTIIINSTFGLKTISPKIKNLISKAFKEELGHMVMIDYNDKKTWEKVSGYPKNKKQNFMVDSEHTFDNFIIGSANRDAFLAAKAVASSLDGSYNPLFIYGDSGLGKTHLLKAIKYYGEIVDNKKIIYLTSETFGNTVVDAINKGTEAIEKIKDGLKSADALIIDDIQFLANREKTIEILFSIFNYFHENRKQLVFSSDKTPDEMNGFNQRIITRLNMGLSFKIQPLDFDTALSIIDKTLEDPSYTFVLSNDSKEYIASFLANDVRKIKGVFSRINFWSATHPQNSEISVQFLTDLFKDMPITNLGKLNVKRIKEIVSEKYGVSVKSIDGQTRTSNIVAARHLAMYLTKEILGHNLTQIGVEFGGKDHTTVMNALTKIEEKISKDASFKKLISSIKNKILVK